MNSVMDDARSIKGISVEGYSWNVGQKDVTKIECYREAGEMGYVPWFAIYEGQTIATRLNGHLVVSVVYQERNMR